MKVSNQQGGFTLIELVVTMTIIAIGAVAIIEIFVGIGNIDQQSRHMAVATQQLQIKVESYRNIAYASIPIGSPAEDFTSSLPADLPSPRSATATITESPAGLKLIDVQISYTEGKVTKRVQVSTYASRHGIGR